MYKSKYLKKICLVIGFVRFHSASDEHPSDSTINCIMLYPVLCHSCALFMTTREGKPVVYASHVV